MNVLLLIWALTFGGSTTPTNTEQPFIYGQAEAGLQYDAANLLFGLYGEYDYQESQIVNKHFKISLTVEEDNHSFGFGYDYNIQTSDYTVSMFMRVQSWGTK